MLRAGFTLIELIVVVCVFVILLAIAVPNYARLASKNELGGARDRLMTALNLARHAAVQNGTRVAACPAGHSPACASNGHWEAGWLVFLDPNGDGTCTDSDGDGKCDTDGGKLLRHAVFENDRITIRGNHFIATGVEFTPIGTASWSHGTISVCDSRGHSAPRGIVISPSGRIRTANAGDPVSCP